MPVRDPVSSDMRLVRGRPLGRRYNHAVTDWMRHDFTSPPSRPTRDEELVFAMTKDGRAMTGSLRRVDDERWEVIYLIDGALYVTQTLGSRELAEQHLAKNRNALEAIGWKEPKLPHLRCHDLRHSAAS